MTTDTLLPHLVHSYFWPLLVEAFLLAVLLSRFLGRKLAKSIPGDLWGLHAFQIAPVQTLVNVRYNLQKDHFSICSLFNSFYVCFCY